MELRQLWAVIVRRWWLIVIPTIVALVLALPTVRGALTSVSGYRVGVRFTASQSPSGSTFEDKSYIPWLASEYVVINLAQWMRTDTFAREVAADLKAQGKDFSADAIRAGILSDSARSIMTMFIDWPDASEVETIAKSAINVLQTRSQSYFPQLAAVKAEIVALDNVIVTPLPTPLSTRIAPLLRIVIGFAAGIGLAFLAEYLDSTLRSRREVEAALELPILTEVPRH